ncbi:MAG: glycosyltransferase family 2 protein [Pseudomonadota bacterium]
MATWSVVATVREPIDVLRAFAAHHLLLGAERVHLYFDDPDDPNLWLFQNERRIIMESCDAAYWRRQGRARPEMIQDRQDINATGALRRCGSDWLVHTDADEFLITRGQVDTALDQIALQEAAVHVPRCERLRPRWRASSSRYDGLFKRTAKRRWLARRLHRLAIWLAYCEDWKLLRMGFFSHIHGKVFVRTGRSEMAHGSHACLRDGSPVEPWHQRSFILLHFFANNQDDWLRKLRFKRPRRLTNGRVRKNWGLVRLRASANGSI